MYNGGSLSKMTVGDDTLYFTYGADGHPLTLTYNATTYFYVTNLQGDVVAILDSTGNPVVQYTYGAWGNVLTATDTSSVSLATLNPLRYRGYVYDHETGLYYLQSRYYDPELGRFLNADAFVSTGQGQLGNNMFAYCNNNPITYTDAAGNWPKLSSIFKAVAVAAVAVVAVAAVVAVVAVAAPAAVAVGGTVISTTAVATAATTVGANALVVTAVSTTAAVVSDKVEKKRSNGYSVYFLEDEYGKIQYVGRVKDNGFDARMRYHYSTRGLVPAKCVSGLSYLEARGLEEIGMIQCHTLNPSNPQNNQIHGIGINNKSGDQYIDAATNYLLNRAENWLLDMIS